MGSAAEGMEASWPLQWDTIGAPGARGALSVGVVPSTEEEMEAVLEKGGFDAVVALIHPAEAIALGVNVSGLGTAAEERQKVFLQFPVSNGVPGEYPDSVALGSVDLDKLREALRAVAALLRTGRRTLVCCTGATSTSALLALCYATFVAGMPLVEAKDLVSSYVPGARPSLAAWDNARTAWSTLEDSNRLRMLAAAQAKERADKGVQGSAVDDWTAARQRLIVEILNEQAEADVALAKVVSRAGSQNGSQNGRATGTMAPGYTNGNAQPATSTNGVAKATTNGNAGKINGVAGDVKEDADSEEARQLRSLLADRDQQLRWLSADLATAERKLAEAQVARKKAEEEIQTLSQAPSPQAAQQPTEIDAFLAQTALGAALRRESELEQKAQELVLSKEGEISSFLAETALASALRQEGEAKEQVGKLEAKVRELSRAQVGGGARLAFLESQALLLRGKEEKARNAAAAATKEGKKLATRLERSEASRRAASEKAESLSAQVAALKEQSLKAEQTEAELHTLRDQVGALSSDLKAAKNAAASATERSEFLTRQVLALRKKLESEAAAKAAAVKAAAAKSAVRSEVESEAQREIKMLREQLSAAKLQAETAQRERDAALAQVATLSEELQVAQKKLQEASTKLLQTEDKVAFLLRQVDNTKVKRRVAEGALTAAKSQVKQMSRSVERMRERLVRSASKGGRSAQEAQTLLSAAEDLYSRLENYGVKLQASISATDEITSQLEARQKAVAMANGSVNGSLPSLPSLADSVPAILAAAEASALESQREQERLLEDVTCLREAMAVLDSSRGEGEEVHKGEGASAVGLFSELVRGAVGNLPGAEAVAVPRKKKEFW